MHTVAMLWDKGLHAYMVVGTPLLGGFLSSPTTLETRQPRAAVEAGRPRARCLGQPSVMAHTCCNYR